MNFDESINKKLARFEGSIMHRVQEKCDSIQNELEDFREQELQKYSNDMEADKRDTLERELREISSSAARELSQKKSEYRRLLLNKREAYVNGIFEEIKNMLFEFSLSPEYKEFLIARAAEFAAECPHGGSKIFVKEADIKFAGDIAAAYGGNCKVESSGDIEIGGALFVNEEKGLIIDGTLNAALDEQRRRFYSDSGFSIIF